MTREEAIEVIEQDIPCERDKDLIEALYIAIKALEKKPTEKCRTCRYGEIYNDIWCKCHDPLLNGATVKMTEKCRAEEIIELNRKFKAERGIKND